MINPGMDADIYDAFIEQLQRYVRERLIPAEDQLEELGRVPDDILAEMRDMGLFGVTMPEEYGGAGMNVSQYVGFIRELAYASPAYRSIVSINIGMVCKSIVGFGTEQQKAHWLPKLAAGSIAAFGLTEPDSGSDSAAMKTRAVQSGNGYVLNGTKRYITNAPFADVILVMARTNAGALPKNAHVSAFLVPRDAPGVSIGKPDGKMGQAGSQIADVILEDVHVDGDALLGGEEGIGFRAAMQSLDNGRLSVAAASVGYAKRMLDAGLQYAMERKAFGEPIANFQLIQAMLADSKAEIYAADCMLNDACARADRGEKILVEAAATKMFASEMCGRVADRVVQIHGGAGYLKEYLAERFYRDCRIYRIYEGTTQIQQLVIAKNMIRDFAG
ncbi:acyl-CoA dehydrogenase family protein [Sphingopyxis sp. SE2]|jgi:acyl-CoA dehydrogenase|uniref:acyl-CoA dehydrogenase family protein n=1 Tax=unclassified Sphingopyxis TaxID=2614943 RepID=UPI00050F6915|nr:MULTISPECIES: acyl-CoA dehydrogenase family protein [unclassified Sphingopyxis]KGB51447.1 Acyl-CoA dehydrogenase-like protein [Sphingopyxis sp. LC363]MDT7528240.1 acyl-CoA dehydrogenase family protein [Sphingopyxis sp. SE2]